MTKSEKITARPGVLSRILDDELVLYDTAAGRVHFLNQTARQVWSLCDGTRGRAGILAGLLEHFDAPREQIEPDLDQLLQRMSDEGLIRH